MTQPEEQRAESSKPVTTAEDPNAAAEQANPLAETPLANLPFTLTVPEIEVRMVNAGSLSHYEIWITAASLSLSTAVGFLVAYFQSFHKNALGQEESDTYLLVAGIVFAALTVLFLIALVLQRRALWKESTRYKMRGTRIIEDPPD